MLPTVSPAYISRGTTTLTELPPPLLARLNYVNSFPASAISYGIDTLAPELLGGAPDFAVSGPNVGSKLGLHE